MLKLLKYALLVLSVILLISYYFKLISDQIEKTQLAHKLAIISSIQREKASKLGCVRERFKNTLLIIVYNSPLYNNIRLLQNLYSKLFMNIIFCGPDHPSAPNWVLKTVTKKGFFTYEECAGRTIDFYHNYTGYLTINDDLFLNILTITNFNLSMIWEIPTNTAESEVKLSGWCWDAPWGVESCVKALDKSISLNFTNLQKEKPYFFKVVSGKHVCYGARADIYYIPYNLARNFSKLAKIYKEEGVFLEIAVPTLIRLLTLDAVMLNGLYMADGITESKAVLNSYSYDLVFLHPVKLFYGSRSSENLIFLQNYTLLASDIIKC